MNKHDCLTFDGTTQPISEWALDYGIPAELIIERLAQGQSVEAAITTMMPFLAAKPARHGSRAHLYTHDGLTLTIAEWAERSGVPRVTLTQRLRRGLPIGEAMNPDLNRKHVPYTYNGETKTLAEWARDYGINYFTLHNRCAVQGLSVGEALNKRKGSRRTSPDAIHTVNGETKTLAEWASHAGVCLRTLRERMSRRGISLGQALEMPKSGRLSVAARRKLDGSANVVNITVAGLRIVVEAAGPGVVVNFEGLKGTGAGSTAQESPEITFSAEAATQ